MYPVGHLRFERGEPFATDSECPVCRFDSVIAMLVILNGVPRFAFWCGRTVCRDSSKPPTANR